MADSSKLIEWLGKSASRLNLQVTEFSWPREWRIPALNDMEVTIEIDGRAFVGRGTAHGEDLAVTKAGAEAIERAYCAGHGIHTIGVAVHTSEALARKNSVSELIERDAFFSHFYTKTPFVPSLEENATLRKNYLGIFEAAESRGITIRFFQTRDSHQPVFLCVASGLAASPAWGGTVGLGSDEYEARAAEAAFLECARNIAAIIHENARHPLTTDAFAAIPDPSSVDRQRLALNGDYWKRVLHLFPENAADAPGGERPTTDASSWATERLPCPFRALEDAPLFVCRTRIDAPLYRAQDRSPTTLRRLEAFTGSALRQDRLETLPHFLG